MSGKANLNNAECSQNPENIVFNSVILVKIVSAQISTYRFIQDCVFPWKQREIYKTFMKITKFK